MENFGLIRDLLDVEGHHSAFRRRHDPEGAWGLHTREQYIARSEMSWNVRVRHSETNEKSKPKPIEPSCRAKIVLIEQGKLGLSYQHLLIYAISV